MKAKLNYHKSPQSLKIRQYEPKPSSEDQAQSEDTNEESPILCRYCGNPITSLRFRLFVDGKHTHIFANPHGLIFEIACFVRADGCAAIGKASQEFLLFLNHTWKVCVCKLCLNHNGWLFESPDHFFFGLITDQLTYP